MKQTVTLLLALISGNIFTQVTYEKGYFISSIGERKECLIQNVDWANNPKEIFYKLTEQGEVQTLTEEAVKEFGVYGASKYVKKKVNIDKSSTNVKDLSYDRNPTFEEDEALISLLVEGEANLYHFVDGNVSVYFYDKDDKEIEQLIYKPYLLEADEVTVNRTYRQQIWMNLKCSVLTEVKIKGLDYTKKALIRTFEAYNECKNAPYITHLPKKKRDLFNLNVRAGVNATTFKAVSVYNHLYNFGSMPAIRLGVEAEILMPFHKNKWAIMVEPTVPVFFNEQLSKSGEARLDYKSIETSLGFRHYFFLNDNSKIFVNTTLILDVRQFSTLAVDNSAALTLYKQPCFSHGVGYKFKDRMLLEVRYLTSRNALAGYKYWTSTSQTLSLVFGYSFF